MKKEEKQTIRLAMLGASGVGKSALCVRFLTKRFIGEYKSDTDLLYKFSKHNQNGSTAVELKDSSPANSMSISDVIKLQLHWADAFVLVYSIIDINSFQWVSQALNILRRNNGCLPVILLANKSDLNHIRKVDYLHGKELACLNSCRFFEVSPADSFDSVTDIFELFINNVIKHKLANECTVNCSPKQKKISVTKMISNLLGKTTNGNTNITEFTIISKKDYTQLSPALRYL